ncbi:MAG: methionyl-tRNA formyltransferase [Bacilli bacterium]|nr:methionyl-tRNA formyltransferase [Bacilli bacterium]MDD4718741.1 methionyl-tRNA formyltransferase [Bacilli bacterium]
MDYSNISINRKLKIVFMGTPEFSVPILEGLIENYKIRAVVTQPDRNGKKDKIIIPPVKQVATENTILVLQPENINKEMDIVLSLEPDLIITCAYGQKLPKEIIEAPRLGCINIHASLLPKLRGGAPIHRAIINGHKTTGITIMHMDNELDQGDIISQEEIEITDEDTASTLHDKLSVLGRDLILKTLPSIINGTAPRIPQDKSEATYAFVLKREDERIKFNKTKKQIYNQIRGLNSWPGAYCLFSGKILKVWESYPTDRRFSNIFDGQITDIYDDGFGVKVSNGEIVFTLVQPEGKTKMNAVDFINGLKNSDSIIGKILD